MQAAGLTAATPDVYRENDAPGNCTDPVNSGDPVKSVLFV